MGTSWGFLGAILGTLGALLGPSWSHLGSFGALLGPSWGRHDGCVAVFTGKCAYAKTLKTIINIAFLGPRVSQDGPKLGQVRPSWA